VGVEFLSGDDENVLESVVMAVELCKYLKNHWLVHFKRVKFIV
jgi:hypothetical protein